VPKITTDVETYFQGYRRKAEPLMERLFDQADSLVAGMNLHPSAQALVSQLRVLSRGGKKLRGGLVLLGYECFPPKRKQYKAVLDASLVMELIHASFLIHDDIMDRDETRRGKDTLHVHFANRHKALHLMGDRGQFGLSMAINAGDLGAFLALNHWNQQPFGLAKRSRAQEVLTRTIIRTTLGQVQDVSLQYEQQAVEEQIMVVYTNKTALYTVVCPLQVGAILGAASDADLVSLHGYGLPVGQAFQIADDLLGVFGTEAELGKLVGSDIKEGKKTLLMLRALEGASGADKEFLQHVLGRDLPSEAGEREEVMERVRSIVRDSGAASFCETLARGLLEEGKRHIPSITPDPTLQKLLGDFADYVIARRN
jgi:geranylgeranyl diphosphate synthase type I